MLNEMKSILFKLFSDCIEQLDDLPQFIKKSLALGISSLIVVIGLVIVHADWQQYKGLQTIELGLKSDFKRKQQRSKAPIYFHTLSLMKKKWSHMLKQFPKDNELTVLLEDISKIGIELGLTFKLFAPQHEIIYKSYKELPIKIRVEGNYFQFLEFISRISQMKHIVTFPQLNIAQAVTGNKNKIYNLVMNATAKITHYRVNDE